MDALQQGVEVETAIVGGRHHDLAVDHAPVGQCRQQWRQQLGEVAGEGSLVAAGQLDRVAVAEDDAAESVPFRFVVPTLADRDLGGGLGQHRRQRWRDRQRHRRKLARNVSAYERRHGRRSSVVGDEQSDGRQARRPSPTPGAGVQRRFADDRSSASTRRARCWPASGSTASSTRAASTSSTCWPATVPRPPASTSGRTPTG